MSHGTTANPTVEETLTFVDTHCHLDDSSFASDLDGVLGQSRNAGVTRWINVGFNAERWPASVDLARRYRGMSCMLGVHPADARIWSDTVRRNLALALENHKPVAIGEIGLDFFRGETNVDTQLGAFNEQLDLAITLGIPAVIHMRSAEPLMLDTLTNRKSLPELLFHSYDGSATLTDWILRAGAYIGVGGLATRSKSGTLQHEIRRVSLDRIVLETDSPYLAPNGFKQRRNTPESIPRIASFLAGLFGIDDATVARQTTLNAERLFERLPPAR